MKTKRLGKFNFTDYIGSWGAVAIYLLCSIASFVLDLSILYVIVPLVCATIRLTTLLLPHYEQFSIHDDSIEVYWGRRRKKIHLPSELTIIVAYADVCPPLAIHTAFGNQTHILKGKYSVSILQEVPIKDVLEVLHQSRIQKYTASSIRTLFGGYRYIYDFVGNQFLLDTLLSQKKCLLIIPESLTKEIAVVQNAENVYIDPGH